MGFGIDVPPLLVHVKIIFDQQDLQESDAIEFFNLFQTRGWKTKTGAPVKNWKHVLDQWIWELKKGI
ncbi:hypothetical protein [Algoriphagus sp. Y33]|uniref:hypothetical protein n=1 Tax=Algoriphagus sp. Y33 TaxID=2772483 RepID=UPI00177D152C|nr:hypothetical protein [Algoriphagus sp. Y33]